MEFKPSDKAVLALIQRRHITKEMREIPQMIHCRLIGYSIHYPAECLICTEKCEQYFNLKAYLEKYKK